MKDGHVRPITRLERIFTSVTSVDVGGALTMATKAKRVQGAEKESSNVRPFLSPHIFTDHFQLFDKLQGKLSV